MSASSASSPSGQFIPTRVSGALAAVDVSRLDDAAADAPAPPPRTRTRADGWTPETLSAFHALRLAEAGLRRGDELADRAAALRGVLGPSIPWLDTTVALMRLCERSATDDAAAGQRTRRAAFEAELVEVLRRLAEEFELAAHERWAADVYDLLLATPGLLPRETATLLHFRAIHCLMIVSEVAEAQSHLEALRLLEAGGDRRAGALVRIAAAERSYVRGDLDGAETELRALAADRHVEGDAEVLARTLFLLGSVLSQRGAYPEAAMVLLRSAQRADTLEQRTVSLGALAEAFRDCGDRAASADCSHLVLSIAERASARHAAHANLLALSILDGDEAEFRRHYEALHAAASAAELPPATEAWFRYDAGRGWAHFGRDEQAREEWRHGRWVAERHELGTVGRAFEAALADQARRVEPPLAAPPGDESLRAVAEAVRALRESGELASEARQSGRRSVDMLFPAPLR